MSKSKSKPARAVLEKMLCGALTFAQMVRAIRETDGVSQSALADRLGIGKSYVSDVENGRKLPTVAKAAEWAEALGYPAEAFVMLALQAQVAEAGLKLRVEVSAA